MTKSKSQVLKEKFEKKFVKTEYVKSGELSYSFKTTVTDPKELWDWISKALKSEYKRGYKDGILMGHFEEAEDKVWYVKQAEKRGYKRGREEGINELMKKIRNKLVETKPMHDRRYEGNYEIEVFDGGFYWMKGRAEGILDEVLDTLKPKKK
jgi:hypothetical protein